MPLNMFQSPSAEVSIDAAFVQRLLLKQYPELAHLPISIVEAGWDNVMARLGDDLAVRLPRRVMGEPRIRNEQLWLPYLAKQLSIPISEPLKIGVPCEDYPFHWSVQHWLPGVAADISPPNEAEVDVLTGFLQELHSLPVPEDLRPNPFRGLPLMTKKDEMANMMAALEIETNIINPSIMAVWDAALTTPIDIPLCWIAGDIHARNVLVRKGKIAAFIDWGDMCQGDPATDLASIWSLFDEASTRRRGEKLYGMSQATIARAKGWAVFYGVFLTVTGRRDTPRHARMGDAILRRVSEDNAVNL